MANPDLADQPPPYSLMRLLLCLATFAAVPAVAAPTQVHLGWQGPADATMTVTWRSTDAAGAVEYGTDAGYGQVTAAASVAYQGSYLHEAELTGLAPGTAYHYRCGAVGSWSGDRSFATGPTPSSSASFRFAVYGDSRRNHADPGARARVRAAVERSRPAFSIHVGDLVTSGRKQADWDEWFTLMEPLVSTTPFVAAIGNHDVGGGLFYEQLPLPHHAPSAAGYEDEAYSSFDYGNVHFVLLSTEHPYRGPGSDPQDLWLEADLARAAEDPATGWIVVAFHRSPYSSSTVGDGTGVALRDRWGRLFERYGVDVVFSGHDHDYERTRPLGGVTYVVTGGAGAPLHAVGRSDFTAFARKTYHLVEVDVSGAALTLTARDDHGDGFDTLTLHRRARARAGGGAPVGK